MDSENNVGAAPGTLGAVVLCRCGCECPASWLCTGNEFDPKEPDSRGEPFHDEPCCDGSKAYLEDSSSELGFPFVARPIHTQNAPRLPDERSEDRQHADVRREDQ